MSRRCSSRHDCTPGWTSWPYTGDLIYDDSADSSDSSDSSDESSDESSYWLYQPHSYSYYTVHTSCPATSCRAPTGKPDKFVHCTAPSLTVLMAVSQMNSYGFAGFLYSLFCEGIFCKRHGYLPGRCSACKQTNARALCKLLSQSTWPCSFLGLEQHCSGSPMRIPFPSRLVVTIVQLVVVTVVRVNC